MVLQQIMCNSEQTPNPSIEGLPSQRWAFTFSFDETGQNRLFPSAPNFAVNAMTQKQTNHAMLVACFDGCYIGVTGERHE
jgi:hypothetical protein